jgi:hypothetical protein
VNMRALLIGTATTLLVAVAIAAPPLAGSWSITPSGSAASSGDLLFRVTSGGGEPVEITVPVHSGSNDLAVARSIGEAMSARLGRGYRVQLGEGSNVLVSDPRGKPSFSIELLDSPVSGLRVSVRTIEPAATPTVPSQSAPATTPPPPTPAQSGAATPPTENPAEAMPPSNPPPMGAPPAGMPQPPEVASPAVSPNATPPPK